MDDLDLDDLESGFRLRDDAAEGLDENKTLISCTPLTPLTSHTSHTPTPDENNQSVRKSSESKDNNENSKKEIIDESNTESNTGSYTESNTSKKTDEELLTESFSLIESRNEFLKSLPKAKNIYDWVTNRMFLNKRLFSVQLGIAVNLFSEYCPDCSDVEYVKRFFNINDTYEDIFNKVTLLEYDKCPKCNKSKVDFIKEGKLKDIVELAGLAGQRSGKSFMVGIFCTYMLHKLLICDNLQEKLHLDSSTTLVGTFVSNMKKQTEESCWGYLKKAFENCWWFNQYTERLLKIDKRLFRSGETFLDFRNKNIRFGTDAANPKTLRGSTGYFGVYDEIGWGSDDFSNKINADEVYKALNNRMVTVSQAFSQWRFENPDVPAPLFISTSSPRERTDKISSLVNDINTYNESEIGKRSKTGRLCYRLATWEINPTLPRDCEEIQRKYADDPIGAERDFGANPPMNSNAFFPEIKFGFVKNSFESGRHNLINIIKHTTIEDAYTYTLNPEEWNKWISDRQNYKERRILALDLGYNNNSTALVIGKLKNDNIIVESVNEIIPSNIKPLDFHKLQTSLLIPLVRKLNISLVICDKWNSLMLLQSISDQLRVQTKSYSLKYLDFLNIKNDLVNKRCQFPMLEDSELVAKCLGGNIREYPDCFTNKPCSHLLFQIFSVAEDKKTVGKGEHTTDDLFRAFSLLNYAIRNYEEPKKQIKQTGCITFSM